MAKITPPGRNDPFVDENLAPTQRATKWTQTVSNLIPLDGTGSPEGVVTATFLRFYFDNTANRLYIKSTTGGNTGWIALN